MITTTQNNLQKTAWLSPEQINAQRVRWHVDAEGATLGRLAVEIAKKLQGKHKAYYCDFWDCGDYIVVTNIDKMVVTGNKMDQKTYYRHSGHKGHLKETKLSELFAKHPDRALIYAVRGMLPKNKLRAPRLKRLKQFIGTNHPYTNHALQPWGTVLPNVQTQQQQQ